MRFADLASLSTRMFKTNPSRTWLTVLGMGVGIAAVVVLVGLGFGLQRIILEEIVFGESLLSLDVSTLSEDGVQLNEESVQGFLAMENVLDVAVLASYPTLVTHEGLTGNLFLDGVSPTYLRYAGTQLEEGETFTEETAASDHNKVLISPSALQLFGIEDPAEAIGESLSFRILVPGESGEREVNISKEYIIKGVTKDEASLSVMMLMPELENYVTPSKYDRVQVRVEDNESLDPTTDALIEEGYNVVALSKTVEQATAIFQGIQAVLAAFGGVALIVSAIGMFNTMTVTLLERTSEIGVMRTIGASANDIKLLFVSEAVVVGFLGGIVGIGIGVGIGFTANTALNFAASQFGGAAVSLFAFPMPFLLFIATFAGVVGFLTGVFPARRAAKLNPLDAIREL